MKGIPEETFVTLRYTVAAYEYGKVNMFATELYKTQPWFSRYYNGVTVLPSSLAVSPGQEAIYSNSQIRVIKPSPYKETVCLKVCI